MADILAADQIRRAERMVGPLPTKAKETILAHFAAAGQDHAPSETSEPSTDGGDAPLPVDNDIQSFSAAAAPSDASSFLIRRPRVAQTANAAMSGYLNTQATDLRGMVDAIADQLAEFRDRYNEQQDMTDSDIHRLFTQQREMKEKLYPIRDELKVFEVRERGRRDEERERRLQPQSPPPPPRAGRPNLTAVAAAVVVLVWLVTEAMLHSKRLSEGYGPFVNGGFNGLGSVVIFGTWGKFLVFDAVMVFLGVSLVLAALGK
ncbi:hypothetical protein C8A05DRAFT_29384 [Staphylotrichum tortipilum]|uniref:Uncharacterized protein n=1 Tax=Staphylotrichum tortipilum TaxID=2831512 RepID=A0AAN6MTA9_9PEZI|nr:hypothetical protein C8A05DRAFT_29384 [Staphylotrichum longicolle]